LIVADRAVAIPHELLYQTGCIACTIIHNALGRGANSMNNTLHQETVKQAVKSKFRGHQPLKSKVTPRYPDSAEREFKRVTNGYMRLLNKTLKEHLPAIMAAYQKERHGDSRFDDARDLDDEVRQELQKVAEELEKKLAAYGLDELVSKIARLTKATSLREWKRVCKETLGIDLLDDYYNGDFYEEALRRWVDENVLKIKSIPNETLGSMREIILTGFQKGKTMTAISKEIQKEYSVSRHKAQMLARDQVATLNSQISKLQQQDAGCAEYTWSTSKDSRVRDCHRALDGKTFSWDNPPEMWYKTKKSGIVHTGRRCHPGEDFTCRCVAIPVFKIETVNVPMQKSTKAKE